MPKLSTFIRNNGEQILAEWETFARSLPAGDFMDIAALRDHAKDMLRVIARDLETPQSRQEQAAKARGESDADTDTEVATAAQAHGAGRAESGFTLEQMVSEFRALRASVVRLWTRQQRDVGPDDLEELTRFNEAIDQAIAESITRFTEAISQSKDRFLAILGHDLRTPLGAIITSTSFMLDTGELTEPYLTLVTRSLTSARRMNQMVADLIDFARTSFGDGIPVVRRPMDAGAMLHDVVAEVAMSHPNRTMKVETSGDLHGQWDRDRLTQALTNLVANAVQHGSDDSPITVMAHGTLDELVLSVHNRGPVIPKAQRGQIFLALQQGADDSARNGDHLGLGLYIAERIVAAHGGTIAVQSSEEEGTTFTARLPRPI
jgi:signal transduction histidine kinase